MTYLLFLNGSLHGVGDLRYIHELITDYLADYGDGMEMVDFSITKEVKRRKIERKKVLA